MRCAIDRPRTGFLWHNFGAQLRMAMITDLHTEFVIILRTNKK